MGYVKTMKYSEMIEYLRNSKVTCIQFIYNMYEWQECFKSIEEFKIFLENTFDKNWLKANKYWVPCNNDNKSIVIVVD